MNNEKENTEDIDYTEAVMALFAEVSIASPQTWMLKMWNGLPVGVERIPAPPPKIVWIDTEAMHRDLKARFPDRPKQVWD